MNAQIQILVRNDVGDVRLIPFVYRDGSLLEIVEGIADYIAGHGYECAYWQGIAADRLRIVLEQNQMLNDARELLTEQRTLIEKLKAEVMPGALAQ